uniref:Uncharacterized protein n=1 Tax=uncultured Caudovirales phage TaxID=2100421 RepID=A0A6J5L5C4_9CAUD|nr:hypothetical protein UFOVP114_42 [uncultured Caudovirales phage]
MAVVAYTSSVVSPGPSNLVDKVIDLASVSLPVTSVPLYGDAVDDDDGSPAWTWQWKIVAKGPGSTAAFLDTGTDTSTLQNPVVTGVNTWDNVRVKLVATNNNPDPVRSSEADTYKAPTSAFVQIRVKSAARGLERLAAGERKWHTAYNWLAAKVNEIIDGVIAAVGVLGGVELEDPPVDAAHPKAITQERVWWNLPIPGSVTPTGFVPGAVLAETNVSPSSGALVAFMVPETFELQLWQVVMQDGGDDTYQFELRTGSYAEYLMNALTPLADSPMYGTASTAHGPLGISKAGPWVLAADTFVAVYCTAAPTVEKGGGAVVQFFGRRKV